MSWCACCIPGVFSLTDVLTDMMEEGFASVCATRSGAVQPDTLQEYLGWPNDGWLARWMRAAWVYRPESGKWKKRGGPSKGDAVALNRFELLRNETQNYHHHAPASRCQPCPAPSHLILRRPASRVSFRHPRKTFTRYLRCTVPASHRFVGRHSPS